MKKYALNGENYMKQLKRALVCFIAITVISAAPVFGADLSLRLLIEDCFVGPVTGPPDTDFAFLGSKSRTVFLIENDTKQTTPIGLASFAAWSDPDPPPGLMGAGRVIVFELEGLVIYAGAIDTDTGPLTTLSVSSPWSSVSGSWTLDDASSAGIAEATTQDAVVTLSIDLNLGPPSFSAQIELVQKNILTQLNSDADISVPRADGISSQIWVSRDIDVHLVEDGMLGPVVGVYSDYGINLSDGTNRSLGLGIFHFGELKLVSISLSGDGISVTCSAAGAGVLAHLSGQCQRFGGGFFVGEIAGIASVDQRWTATLTMP